MVDRETVDKYKHSIVLNTTEFLRSRYDDEKRTYFYEPDLLALFDRNLLRSLFTLVARGLRKAFGKTTSLLLW